MATAASPIEIEPSPARITAIDSVAIEHRGGDEGPHGREREALAHELVQTREAVSQSPPCQRRNVGTTP